MADIVIIGAGTAGMTAAVYAARAGKEALVLEQESFGGQILYAPAVENYPGVARISGAEFASNLTEQALSLGAQLEMEQALGVVPGQAGFTVITDGEEIRCGSVILATGVRRRPLGVAREKELAGQGVSYCAVCDGAFYKGQEVAVVGGGNTALEDALFLSAYCSKVTLIHRRETFRADKSLVDRAREKENIEFVLDTVVDALEGDDCLSGIRLRGADGAVSHRAVNGLFVAVGQITRKTKGLRMWRCWTTQAISSRGRTAKPPHRAFLPPATAAPSGCASCQPPPPMGRSRPWPPALTARGVEQL